MNFYSFTKHLSVFFIGVWIGILALLGYGVAPEIFKFMESKTQAGLLNGIILHKMNTQEWVVGILLFLSVTVSYVLKKQKKNLIVAVVAVLMLGLLFYYSRIITPNMEQLKTVIGNFDISKSDDSRPERADFDRYHQQYSGLVKTNLILGIGLMFFISFNRKNE